MPRYAKELITLLDDFFQPSGRRYTASLAPLIPQRPKAPRHLLARRISVFGRVL